MNVYCVQWAVGAALYGGCCNVTLHLLQIADYFVDPLCRGIYAGKARELSVKSCFPHLFNTEQKYGSVLTGSVADYVQNFYQSSLHSAGPVSSLSKKAQQDHWTIYTLKSGLQRLPNVLYQRLLDRATVMTNTTCDKVEFTSNGIVKVSPEQ